MNRWPFDWPKAKGHTEGRTPREKMGVLMDEHVAAWRPHRPLIRFLQDHYSLVWSAREWTDRDGRLHGEGVRWCRTEPNDGQRREEDGLEVVEMKGCGRTPFCPACNDHAARRRGKKILDKLIAATPANEDVTVQLVTLGVTERPGDETGIVEAVSGDWRTFRDAAYRVIEWMYGEGVGAFLTYQEYGQRVLVKKRTHVHALVHHWREENGRARKIEKFELDGGGKARLDARWYDELQRDFPNITRPKGSTWVGAHDVDLRYLDHPGKIAKSTKYVAREIIDMRELRYDRTAQTITVYPYKAEDSLAPVTASVAEVQRNLMDYAARVGRWGYRGRPIVHAAYGNVSDGLVRETISRIGRGKEHPEDCWCRECSRWQKFWEDAPRARPIS